MSQYLTALTGAGTTVAVGLTFMARIWPAPTRRPQAAVLDEASLGELLDGGEVEGNDFADCPVEGRTTFHALQMDGSRRCWTCSAETPAGAA